MIVAAITSSLLPYPLHISYLCLMNPVSLPPAFVNRINQQFPSEAEAFFQSQAIPSPISFRLNPLKLDRKLPFEKIPWATHGYYLPQRPAFTLDPLLHAGAYYVQEASSMLLEQAFRQLAGPGQPLRVLDLCGAPGGKSTLLASLLSGDSLLVSNEVIRSRAEILAENVTKWGAPNVIVTNNDPRDFQRLQGFFDVMVVDAPCSGEGLFRKDRQAINEWSPENASLCADRQRRILIDAWPALKPGGTLIYSTCTYNPAENEENIAWLAAQGNVTPLPLTLADSWGIRAVEAGNGIAGYQLMPHRAKGEGFFISVLRKNEGQEWQPARKQHFPLAPVAKKEAEEVKEWLTGPAELFLHQENILAFPPHDLAAWGAVVRALRIVQAGVAMAEIKKKNLVPAPALALATVLKKEAFSAQELSLEEAVRYLRKEEWPIDPGHNGWQLASYKGLPLGWIKRIGHRFNNYYPLHWRIRMDLPRELPESFL